VYRIFPDIVGCLVVKGKNYSTRCLEGCRREVRGIPCSTARERRSVFAEMETSTEIEWGKPPTPRVSNWGRWRRFVEEARARPGEWASMAAPTAVAASTVVYRIRGTQEIHKLAEPGEFEALAREKIVYARYVGGEQE